MRPLTLCYVNAHVDVINTAIDMSAHWLLDVVPANQGHEFFAGVRRLISDLRRFLHKSIHVLISVYSFRPFGVMRRTQVDREAMRFADLAKALAKENMMFVY